jgi:general secretion pathway protein D
MVNSIEYRDTGVLLTVKPRVNAGGLVIMEVEQEVSQAPTTNWTTLTPRIRQRKISSTVAINSGDTIILGGLIEENRDLNESGLYPCCTRCQSSARCSAPRKTTRTAPS